MLVDWFTVGAQALNFLILVWLLKRFLYHPVLHAIDVRNRGIASAIASAEAAKAQADKDRDDFKRKNDVFDQQRATLLSAARDEANTEGRRLLAEARQTADALSAKRQEALRADAQSLHQAIARRAQQEVFAITRKALTDLATTSLEERLGEVFTRRLRTMDAGAKSRLGEALKTASVPGVVRSTFDLPVSERAAIQNALNETFSADVHIRFETAPEVVCGIELSANGQKVGWSIADYLTSLEAGVDELLTANERRGAEPKPGVVATPGPKSP
jgi:F-type H+-transporting ATPase subunit b